MDADAHVEQRQPARRPALVEVGEGPVHRRRRLHGVQGVLRIGDEHVEHGHHGVADEVVDHPLMREDGGRHRVEVLVEVRRDRLRRHRLRQRRVTAQVGEEHRHHAALAAQARRVVDHARQEVLREISAELVAHAPPRQEVGEEAHDARGEHGQQEVDPVATAVEGQPRRRHADDEAADRAHERAPHRLHRKQHQARAQHHHRAHAEPEDPARRLDEPPRGEHVDDVGVDLDAGHEAVRRLVEIAAVLKGAAQHRDAPAQRVVGGDLGIGLGERGHDVRGDGQKASRRADVIDRPQVACPHGHRRWCLHRPARARLRDRHRAARAHRRQQRHRIGAADARGHRDTQRGHDPVASRHDRRHVADEPVVVDRHLRRAGDDRAAQRAGAERAPDGAEWSRHDDAAHAVFAEIADRARQRGIVGRRGRRAQRDVEPDGGDAAALQPADHPREVVARDRLAPAEALEGRLVDRNDDDVIRRAVPLQAQEEVEAARLPPFQVAEGGGGGDEHARDETDRPELQQTGTARAPPAHRLPTLAQGPN